MKKILLIAAVAGFVMASCKKDYVCECTSTSTAPNSTTTTYKYNILDASKKQAKANCFKTSSDFTIGSTTYTDTDDCKLK